MLYGTARGWLSFRAVQRLARRVPTVWTFHDEWPILPGLPVDLHGIVPPERVAAVIRSDQPVTRDDPRAQRARRRFLPQLPRPTAIICPSDHLATLAARAAVRRCAHPPGAAFPAVPRRSRRPAFRRPAPAASSDCPLMPCWVAMVAASLDDWFKGTALGFEVVRRIRSRSPVVVGDASPRTMADMPAGVIHLGFVTGDAMLAHVYRAVDVLLMSLLGENFLYVALEALACETFVAAFHVGGLAEVIATTNGACWPPFETAGLAAAIDALLRDGDRRASCGACGRRWVESTCDVGRSVETHLAIYRQAITDFDRRRAADSDGVTSSGHAVRVDGPGRLVSVRPPPWPWTGGHPAARGSTDPLVAHADVPEKRLRVRRQLGRGTAHHATALEDGDAVGHAQHGVHLLLDQQDADPTRRSADTVPSSRSTSIGISPSLGSSIRTCVGRAHSARAVASICCSPPLSVPARWPRRSRSTGKSPAPAGASPPRPRAPGGPSGGSRPP